MVQGVIMVYYLDVQAGLRILVQNCGIFVRSSIALSELCGARVPCQTFGSPTSQIVFYEFWRWNLRVSVHISHWRQHSQCKMSACHYLPSFWEKLSKLVEIWRSSDKNNFTQFFFETRCI